MPPIRKGDGTPVTPKGISQIRTGDGRILFDGPAIPDTATCRTADDDSSDTDRGRGVRFELKSEFSSVEYQISSNSSGFDEALLIEVDDDNDDHTVVVTKNVGGLSGTDVFSIDYGYEVGVTYAIELHTDDGSLWDYGRNLDPDFPYDGDDVVLTNGSGTGGDVEDIGQAIVCVGGGLS